MKQQPCRFQLIRIHAKERNVPFRNTVHSVNLLPPLFFKLPNKPLGFQLPLQHVLNTAQHGKLPLRNFMNILISTFQIWSAQISSFLPNFSTNLL
jgi:hypothetical protein